MRYLRNISTILLVVCIALSQFSCSNKRKTLILPELPLYSLEQGTYEDPSAFGGKKKYVASLSSQQTKARLKRIQPAIKSALAKGLNVVVYIDSKDSEKIISSIQELNFQYPVVIDSDGLFKKQNKERPEMGYNGYIVNKQNEIIGTPAMRMSR
jgi:hypothetical protein